MFFVFGPIVSFPTCLCFSVILVLLLESIHLIVEPWCVVSIAHFLRWDPFLDFFQFSVTKGFPIFIHCSFNKEGYNFG